MEDIINYIENQEFIDFENTFKIFKIISDLITTDESSSQKLLVNVLANLSKFDSSLNPILADLIEGIGFYPYISKENLELTSTDALIRNAYHFSSNIGKVLHEDQKYLLSLLNNTQNIIVSAPTSFGKSLLIEEIVATLKYKNIIIIQPTLALLDETRKKLLKYRENYKIIVRTTQTPSVDKKNLFLLTAERVNEYKQFSNVDLIIIDEFYKLSAKRDDERADSLNNAFNYILKTFNPKFYLLGPNIDSISEGFAEKYNAIFYRTKSSLVDTKVIDMYKPHKDFFDKPIKYKEYKENVLFELLLSLQNEQSIIYCSSPARVRYLSLKFLEFLVKNKVNLNQYVEIDLIEWIEINISTEWSLIDLLNNQIGIHDGALQKHITNTIIEYFNENKLKFLFCTSTIIEGVNTSAKNIIYFDKTKGNNVEIDFFDYSNIKGRAGRLMIHYIGKIFNFNLVPEDEKVIVDIPFYEQNPISNEILINLEYNEVKDENLKQYSVILEIPENERNIIRDNGVQVFGQKNIFEEIRVNFKNVYPLISWTRYPNYEQLKYCLTLGWNYLMKKTESKSLGIGRLVNKTFGYGNHNSIKVLINNDIDYVIECINFYEDNKDKIKEEIEEIRKFNYGKKYFSKSNFEIEEEFILMNFQIQKHWFEYKIPKWLSVINSIQECICNEYGVRPGNYSYYSNKIENDFLRENLSLLSEFGIPSSALKKLEKLIPSDLNEEQVIDYIRNEKIFRNEVFINYEKNKFKEI